ncbi:MAG: TM2 domain-containing protein [Oscillospiraceae bacterium]|nr:TM2 domain-containing protein [Oscillospiraceae bacterium]
MSLETSIDNYLVANAKNFPEEKIPMLRLRMMEMGSEEKVAAISGLGLKSPIVCLIIAIIPYVGWFLDRWYLREYWFGFIKAITFGGVCVWWIVDMFTAMKRTREYNFDAIMNYINSFDVRGGAPLNTRGY